MPSPVEMHWKIVDGVEQMPPLLSEFLDWILTDPRMPATQAEWAKEHGFHADTPRRWKVDPRFRKEWERRAAEKNIGIDRIQGVVDAMHTAALSGDVKAMALYLQYVDRFTPKQIVVTEGSDTKGLSDEELVAQYRRELGIASDDELESALG
jgi:hypothetical protein